MACANGETLSSLDPASNTSPDSTGPPSPTDPHCPSMTSPYVPSSTEDCPSVAMPDNDSDMDLEATNDKQKKRDGKRSREDDADTMQLEEIMDHSGLYSNKKMRRLHKNGALLCLPLSLDRLKDKPLDAVSKELARCLHESKHMLVRDVVRVLEVERTLDIFKRTVVIQETGGRMTASGDEKRLPGGVFLTLVKELCTSEEQKDIFQKDKQMKERKKKMAKQRKKEKERIQRIQEQRHRHAEFEATPAPGPAISEWDCPLPSVPRISESLRKRLGKAATQTDKETGDDDNSMAEPVVKVLPNSLDSGRLQEETKAAEDFEQISDYQFDFGID